MTDDLLTRAKAAKYDSMPDRARTFKLIDELISEIEQLRIHAYCHECETPFDGGPGWLPQLCPGCQADEIETQLRYGHVLSHEYERSKTERMRELLDIVRAKLLEQSR